MSFDSIQYNVLELPVKENNFTAIVTVTATKNGKVFQSFATASGSSNDITNITDNAKAKALDDISCNVSVQPVLTSPSRMTNTSSQSYSSNSNKPSEKQLLWMEKNDVNDETTQRLYNKNISELSKKEAHELINSLWKK